MAILLGLAALFSTFAGGLFALRHHKYLNLILGFSAGAVIGVAFFDLLPESLNLVGNFYSISRVTSVIALGFLIYMLLSQWILLHPHHDHEDEHCENQKHQGQLGAGSLSIHSFLDGMAIGLAFKVSPSVGAIVAIAVLVHDFSDGINTVGMILRGKGSQQQAFHWLWIDALAPVAGVLSTSVFTLSDDKLGLVLALFCGFFLYIGASDLLPESHHRRPRLSTALATVVGAVVLYTAITITQSW